MIKMKSIKALIDNFVDNDNKIDKKQYLINYLKNIKEENKVIFKDSIQINDIIIQKDELNFVLGVLLYLKKIGNIAAHPNIESNIDTEINELSNQIKGIKELIEPNRNSKDNFSNGNLLIDLSLKNMVKAGLINLENEILDNYKNISFNKNAKVENILDYMLKNESKNIIKEDSAFLRVIKIEMENIINDERDFNEEDIYNDIKNYKIVNYNNILSKINEYEKKISNEIEEFKSYDIKSSESFEFNFKSKIKKCDNLNFMTFLLLIKDYKNMLNKDLTNAEKKAYLITIFAKEYLKDNKFIQKKTIIEKELRELIKCNVIKRKFNRICNLIDKICADNVNNCDDVSFINEVKNYIKELNFEGSERIIGISLNIEKIIDILKLLIKEKNFDWLALSKEEIASISSYIYYMQNKSI